MQTQPIAFSALSQPELELLFRNLTSAPDTFSDTVYAFASTRKDVGYVDASQFMWLGELVVDADNYDAMQYLMWYIFRSTGPEIDTLVARAHQKNSMNAEKAIIANMRSSYSFIDVDNDIERFRDHDFAQLHAASTPEDVRCCMIQTRVMDVIVAGAEKLEELGCSDDDIAEFLVELLDDSEDSDYYDNAEHKLFLYAGRRKNYALLESLFNEFMPARTTTYSVDDQFPEILDVVFELNDYEATRILIYPVHIRDRKLKFLMPAVEQRLYNVLKGFYAQMPYLMAKFLYRLEKRKPDAFKDITEHAGIPALTDSTEMLLLTSTNVYEFVFALEKEYLKSPRDFRVEIDRFLKRSDMHPMSLFCYCFDNDSLAAVPAFLALPKVDDEASPAMFTQPFCRDSNKMTKELARVMFDRETLTALGVDPATAVEFFLLTEKKDEPPSMEAEIVRRQLPEFF